MGIRFVEEEGQFKVVEDLSGTRMVLSTHKTRSEAIEEVRVWKTREDLGTDIEDFIDSMVGKYGGTLSPDEVRSTIKGY